MFYILPQLSELLFIVLIVTVIIYGRRFRRKQKMEANTPEEMAEAAIK